MSNTKKQAKIKCQIAQTSVRVAKRCDGGISRNLNNFPLVSRGIYESKQLNLAFVPQNIAVHIYTVGKISGCTKIDGGAPNISALL